jgi:predicted RNase H-like HicB family nuclease
MRYTIAIEPSGLSTTFGAIAPDLRGYFYADDTFDEALCAVEETAAAWMDSTLDAGEAIPPPSR